MKYIKYKSKDVAGATNILVAEDAKSILYCSYDNQENEVYLSCLHVHIKYRYCGRAKDIMYEAENWAYEKGADCIRLECHKDLVPFYQKMGYEVTYESDILTSMMKKL